MENSNLSMESLAVETAEERYYPFDKADDDDDDDEDHQGTSAFVAFVNITKCFAGASSFELPFALMEGGLIAGTLGTIVFAFLSFASFLTLVECGKLVRGASRPSLLEVSTAAYGRWLGRGAILFAMSAMTLGVCGTYLDFIGQTISNLVTPHVPWLNKRLCTLGALPFATALSLVRSQRVMAITSVLGIVAVIVGCSFVIYDATTRPDVVWHNPFTSDAYGPAIKWRTYGSFMGNAGYLYLISTAVLPIEQQMKKRKSFKCVLGLSVAFTTVLNVAFAIVAAMAYSTTVVGVEDVILLNLRPGVIAACVKIFAATNLLFSYGLFLGPYADSIEKWWFGGGKKLDEDATAKNDLLATLSPTHSQAGEEEGFLRSASLTEEALAPAAAPQLLPPRASLVSHLAVCLKSAGVRIFLCAVTFGVTQAVPDFGLLTGLTGGFGDNMLAFIMTPLLYVKLQHAASYWSTRSAAGARRVAVSKIAELGLQLILFVFGILLFVLSIYSTIVEVRRKYL